MFTVVGTSFGTVSTMKFNNPVRTYLNIFIVVAYGLMSSCARRHYLTEAGSVRPIKKNVFSYASKFKAFNPLIDTTSLYIRHWDYHSVAGLNNVYEYFRFFSTGHVLYFGFDTTLNLSVADDLERGIIGRYHFKKDQLRIQLFYPVSISRSLSKTYGFIKDYNIYTYDETPETWCGSYRATKAFGKDKLIEWKKYPMTFKSNIRPDW
jgi:hypothetical protein